ncbi:MAG TPA: hypothetical protein VMV01_09320 [Planctomycetota bacterium]|nr:hypothetical protein [Planctomycetota bacterium]
MAAEGGLAEVGRLALGLLLLTLGADSLLKGASGLSLRLGLQPARVGVLALLLGSALPELAFGLQAGMEGAPELAYAVLLERALINLGLLLGALHLLVTLPRASRVTTLAAGAALGAALLFWWQSRNGVISRIEGLTSLSLLALLLAFGAARSVQASAPLRSDLEALAATRSENWRSALRVAIGMAALLFGARYLFEASQRLSSVGPWAALLPALILSLPLLGSAWFAGWRGFPHAALGLLLGSTVSNLLLAAGIVSFAEVLPVPASVASFGLPLLLALSVLALGACASDRPGPPTKGVLLVLAGAGTIAILIARVAG